MVDKVIKRVNTSRLSMWSAFKGACNIHGYNYYEIPAELRYRYPAPGSCAHDQIDHPNLYKKHWKTPFRDSNYNIRNVEKVVTMEDNTDHFISEMPKLDPNNPEDAAYLREMQPDTSDLKEMYAADEPAIDSAEGL